MYNEYNQLQPYCEGTESRLTGRLGHLQSSLYTKNLLEYEAADAWGPSQCLAWGQDMRPDLEVGSSEMPMISEIASSGGSPSATGYPQNLHSACLGTSC